MQPLNGGWKAIETDQKLNEIALSSSNEEALGESDESQSEEEPKETTRSRKAA